MSNLTPSPSWPAVTQIETSTAVLGGPGGPMNAQAQALLNRTELLYGRHAPAIIGFNATNTPDGEVIVFASRSVAGDGGGGTFRYSAGSTQPADGGLVFAPTGGGRLFREGWTVFGFNGAVRPKWFGAKVDGTTVDTDAMLAAMLTQEDIELEHGVMLIGPTALSGDFMLYMGTSGGRPSRDNTTIFGSGDGCVIKMANNVGPNRLLFAAGTGDSLRNVTFRDFRFDLNGANNLQANFADPLRYNSAGYFFCRCDNVRFERVTFDNGSGSQIVRMGNDTSAGYGKGNAIIDCKVNGFGIGIPGNNLQDVSVFYIQGDDTVCQNNIIKCDDFTFDPSRGHTAFELHGENATSVMMNHFHYVQMPVLIASAHKAVKNVEIAFNQYHQCMLIASLDPSLLDQKMFKVHHNTFFSTKAVSSSVFKVGMSGETAKVRENIEFSDNMVIAWGNTTQDVALVYIENAWIRSLSINRNTVMGLHGPLLYLGGVIQNDDYLDVEVLDNTCDSLGSASGVYPNFPTFVHVETTSGAIRSMDVSGNRLLNTVGKNYAAGQLYFSGVIRHLTAIDNRSAADTSYPLVADTSTAPGSGQSTRRIDYTSAIGPLRVRDIALTNATVGTTVGAAGGASALPATPLGYVSISINGTARKIPYYNT